MAVLTAKMAIGLMEKQILSLDTDEIEAIVDFAKSAKMLEAALPDDE